jgi:hypothetical protein
MVSSEDPGNLARQLECYAVDADGPSKTFQKGIPHTELAWLLGAVGMPICACRLKCRSDVAWILGRKDAAGD